MSSTTHEQSAVTLFLIEDDDIAAEAIRRALAKRSISNPLVRARDGVEALELLRASRGGVRDPQVMLLDLNMPRMNGVEFLRELRKDPRLRGKIVFVLTTSDSDRDKAEAFDLNVAGYMVKDKTGPDFSELIDLLSIYWSIVEFPGDYMQRHLQG